MSGGGGGIGKRVINYVVDNPANIYLGGAALLWSIRNVQIRQTYNYYFGRFEFERRLAA